MGWFDRRFRLALTLVWVGLAVLLTKQVLVIAEHGVGGWLRGDGGFQTEWEVGAVVGLLLIGLPAVVVLSLLRSTEGPIRRFKETRWERAAEREIRRTRRPPR